MTGRTTLVLLLVVALGLGIAASRTSPPKLLSLLDWMVGGGIGSDLAGEAVSFGTHGQKLDIWRPSQPSGPKRPVVIFWHGGGWVHGSRGDYGFAARAYAAKGFIVVVPDYRKVPQIRFPAMLVDGAQAVKWTRDHIAEYGGDPERIALAGHSAGAYTVAMLALDPRWLSAEGVDRRIVKAGIGLSGPYDFYPFTKKRSIDAMKGVKEPLLTQPINFASADAPPMMLVTSSKDTQVRPYNAVNLAAKLEGFGAKVELENHQGLSHEDVVMALSKPFRGKAPVLDDSIKFINAAMRE